MTSKKGRAPGTPFEQRVDFEAISEAQIRRRSTLLRDLRKVLFLMRTDALGWAQDNLVKKKLKTAVPKFRLSRTAAYRSVIRRRLTAAAIRGVEDVANEADASRPKLKVADLTRIRAQADALVDDHITTLEGNLKREWSKATQGNISKEQIRYVTEMVFADFAGWERPIPPKG